MPTDWDPTTSEIKVSRKNLSIDEKKKMKIHPSDLSLPRVTGRSFHCFRLFDDVLAAAAACVVVIVLVGLLLLVLTSRQPLVKPMHRPLPDLTENDRCSIDSSNAFRSIFAELSSNRTRS